MTDEEKAALEAKAKADAEAAAKTAADQAAAGTATTTTPATGAGSASGTGTKTVDASSVDTLTDDELALLDTKSQAYIRKLREENAKDRTASKTKAAEEARNELTRKIGKALGLIEDPDPATIAQVAASERDTARQEAKAAKIENAVLRMAAKHGASPEALTDSRTFMTKLADTDPAAEDFAAKVETAIKAALEDNPNLKIAPATAERSGGPVGGGAPPGGEKSVEDFVAEFNKTK
jgi:hypothetical protein